MSMIGNAITIASATDPTKVGRKGVVMTETAKTILLDVGGDSIRVEKHGVVFLISRSGEVVLGDDISGRPEDRLGGRKK